LQAPRLQSARCVACANRVAATAQARRHNKCEPSTRDKDGAGAVILSAVRSGACAHAGDRASKWQDGGGSKSPLPVVCNGAAVMARDNNDQVCPFSTRYDLRSPRVVYQSRRTCAAAHVATMLLQLVCVLAQRRVQPDQILWLSRPAALAKTAAPALVNSTHGRACNDALLYITSGLLCLQPQPYNKSKPALGSTLFGRTCISIAVDHLQREQ
jgi:hypothetical protein